MAATRAGAALSFLFEAWKVRPNSRRVLWAIAALLGLAGTALLAFEPLTGIFAGRQQVRLAASFKSLEFRTQFQKRAILPGEVLTRIQIPAIGVDAMVVEGTEPDALRAGAGHYSDSPLPCEPGNVAIAGHRTTYGAPFMRLDELAEGDEIMLVVPERSCIYRVVTGPGPQRPRRAAAGWITHPNDAEVIGPLEGSWLTLTTCHPKRSAAKRLIVRAVGLP